MKIKTIQNKSIKATPSISILDSAINAGLMFEYSCKNGQCGECKVTLLQGEIEELQPQMALSDSDRRNKKILNCCCAPKTDILIDSEDLSALKGIEIKTFPVRINKIEKKTEKIVEVELRLPPSANLTFLEGQYIDVIGPNNVRRSYSIANSTNHNTIVLWIKMVEGGKLSQYWFNEAQKNDLLRIEGPKGTFFFREEQKRIILLATGTGIAPIKSILDKLAQTSSNLIISLYWGNRTPEDFFWQPEYKNLDFKYTPVLSRNNDSWINKIGYVQNVALEEYKQLEDTEVYACGSIEMIASAKELFIKHGLEEKDFHSDAFVSS